VQQNLFVAPVFIYTKALSALMLLVGIFVLNSK